MNKVMTIGVYGWSAERFFAALLTAGVHTLCDIRRRRGVRGPEYAFANSLRLQARLADLGIGYIHRPDLAPSDGLRAAQHAADAHTQTARRKRTHLSGDFVDGYRREVISSLDATMLAAELALSTGTIVLMCVEGAPDACHRSLLAEFLSLELGIVVEHLIPEQTVGP